MGSKKYKYQSNSTLVNVPGSVLLNKVFFGQRKANGFEKKILICLLGKVEKNIFEMLDCCFTGGCWTSKQSTQDEGISIYITNIFT